MIPLVMSVIAKTETFQRDMAKAGNSVNKFGTTASKTTAMVTKLGRSLMMMAGVGGGIYMLQRGLRGLRTSVEEFAGFEYAMAKVSTMLNEQSMKYLPAYSKEIRNMATEYGASTADMTEGLYMLLSGQIKASEAMNVLRESVESAKGGFASTADTVKATIRIMNAYGMELNQVGKVQDILHATVNKGLLDFSELAQTIGNALGLAAPLGADLEAVAATMALLTNTTQDADEAVTSLKNIFNQLKDPSLEQIAIAKKLGFAMDETSVRGAGLIDIYEGLQKASVKDLAVLMPTIRGYAGFSQMLKKAGDVRAIYNFIVNSTGLKEANLQKAMANTSTQLDIAKRKYGELRLIIGEELAPAFITLMESMEKASANGEFAASIHENIAVVYEFADALTNLDEILAKIAPEKWGGKTYKDLAAQHRMMADVERARGTQPELDKKVADMKAKAAWPDVSEMVILGSENKSTSGAGVPAAKTDEEIQAEVDATREKLASIRSMYDKTRMEKIQMLEDYRMAHFGHTEEIEAAEQLLNDEILSLQQSRVDAMVVYNAELREDMQDSTLYISEQFASAARSIEGSMSSAFQNIIKDSDNWRESMQSFFQSIGDSFAKMVSDMIARWIMFQTITAIGGLFSGGAGGGGGGGGGFPGGGSQQTSGGMPFYRHSGWIPAGVPSFQRGRGLKSNEMAAIIEKDEMLVPNKQIIKSGRSALGQAAVTNNYYTEIKAMDSQSVQAALAKEKNFLSDLRVSSRNSNHPDRRLR